jgi:hypothetical protein
VTTFRHSGKLGDIIYSLPAIQARGGGAVLIDYRTSYFEKPPLGREPALMIAELLRTQDYVREAALYEDGPIDYDLDQFRAKAVLIHAFNCIRSESDQVAGALFGGVVRELRRNLIPRLEVDLPQLHWECVGLPGRVNLTRPWITGIPQKQVAEIVVSKTLRHPGSFDWSVLAPRRDRSVFLGLESEWKNFCDCHFPIAFYQVASLLEFAQVLAGSKLFVGNQSFGLALADAMLIPRAAQLWEASPNSMPPSNSYRTLTPEIVRRHVDL